MLSREPEIQILRVGPEILSNDNVVVLMEVIQNILTNFRKCLDAHPGRCCLVSKPASVLGSASSMSIETEVEPFDSRLEQRHF